MQESDSFHVNYLLTFCGGIQDAYSYLLRGKVFASAQTGNIVLLGINLLEGKFNMVGHYIVPVIAFVSGIIISDQIEKRFKNMTVIHWRQIVTLLCAVILIFAGLVPSKYYSLSAVLVSFTCALEVETFKKVHGHSYANAMCIGNLKSLGTNISGYILKRDSSSLKNSILYFMLMVLYMFGVIACSLLSKYLENMTIIMGSIVLIVVYVLLGIRKGN